MGGELRGRKNREDEMWDPTMFFIQILYPHMEKIWGERAYSTYALTSFQPLLRSPLKSSSLAIKH